MACCTDLVARAACHSVVWLVEMYHYLLQVKTRCTGDVYMKRERKSFSSKGRSSHREIDHPRLVVLCSSWSVCTYTVSCTVSSFNVTRIEPRNAFASPGKKRNNFPLTDRKKNSLAPHTRILRGRVAFSRLSRVPTASAWWLETGIVSDTCRFSSVGH